MLTGVVACGSWAQPTLQELILPTGLNGAATGVSEAANVATGWSTYGWSFSQFRAFRWTASGGIENLGGLPNMPNSRGTAISDDGEALTGFAWGAAGTRAFIWTPADGMQSLGVLPGSNHSYGYDVSGDGTTVVGACDGSGGFRTAFVWTSQGGMFALVPPSQFAPQSSARAVSRDGAVVVGNISTATGTRAFVWTPTAGIIDLGLPMGATEATATAVSDDGATVAGWALFPESQVPQRAFRWRHTTGFEDIGCLAGMTEPRVNAISADGGLLVGQCQLNGGTRGFAWTLLGGLESLDVYLEARGLLLNGRVIESAWDMTASGDALAVQSNYAALVSGLPPSCSPPSITRQPGDTWIGPLQMMSLACESSSIEASFQWSHNDIPLSDDGRISGSHSSTLSVASFGPADQGTYQCSVTNTCETTVSDQVQASCRVRMLVVPPAALVRAGSTHRLRIEHSNAGPATFRWKRDGVSLFNSGAYSGVATAELTIQTTDPGQSGAYTLSATNACGASTSAAVQIVVYCGSDWNVDGSVDGDDVIAFMGAWDENALPADFTQDGSVDGDDVIGFFERWDAGC